MLGFVDLCKDEFKTHFTSKEDGTWQGIIEAGRYTIDILRLNREHLVQARLLLRRLGVDTLGKATSADELAGLFSRTAGSSSDL
jgi:hypothetical protein